MKKNYSQSVTIKDLMLFSVYLVLSKDKKCTFSKLVKKCFSSFPDIFSFSDIPEWPDSRKLDRPLRSLKEEKMIKGDIRGSFELTKKGGEKAREISGRLTQMRLKI